MNINLKNYGLNERFNQEATLYEGLFIARVTEQHRELYKVINEWGEMEASVSGKLAYQADDQTSFPAVGDWVMIDRLEGSNGKAIIHHILRRKSVLARQAAGTENVGQVIAANIDTIFICMSLNADFNVRRIERYLTIAWDSMATPVIILTKSDLCNDLPLKLKEIASVSMGVAVIICSSENEEGFGELNAYIRPEETIAFVGSSGVGKSTLINCLMGQNVLATNGIREEDAKGRHTTTHRQLLLLPKGGIVIDTPGMRELQIHTGNLSKTFEDVEEIAAQCKFGDCSHGVEPGCAIREAIEKGTLSQKRFESYQKLQREVSYDGLNARQLENEKLHRMFGGKAEMKQLKKYMKDKKNNR
ncbi:ribosome small subunit-dependent GTPase A [Aminipila butyrica]|uniref:Small ribosomal subunit biogenesis GTPase RsgA n=1 Tax=Aminipila butyrica TaxID=433296 RepID=A0A858C002_9FIRM|nr:ribosome small subunit-dependent GTPase A [Aminipila butyrica]QIB70725.1 ribosome small subunit-dependent GTPase A [Aminipila butyrica]